jgi:molybdopterin molybdotransferase
VLSTADELAAPGDALAPGKIRDANRPMLLARLRAIGWLWLEQVPGVIVLG